MTLHVPANPVRFVTAASLFDGHDASINIMRRILQAQGAEVIHLGHNRSVAEVVRAAVQEDVQGVAISSYQGGHVEYFTYLRESLDAAGGADVRVYGGGGGVIVEDEIAVLASRGVTIFSPADGQLLGLPGMINTMIAACDVDPARGGSVMITSGWPWRAMKSSVRMSFMSPAKNFVFSSPLMRAFSFASTMASGTYSMPITSRA